jgi:hypothetical protein
MKLRPVTADSSISLCRRVGGPPHVHTRPVERREALTRPLFVSHPRMPPPAKSTGPARRQTRDRRALADLPVSGAQQALEQQPLERQCGHLVGQLARGFGVDQTDPAGLGSGGDALVPDGLGSIRGLCVLLIVKRDGWSQEDQELRGQSSGVRGHARGAGELQFR